MRTKERLFKITDGQTGRIKEIVLTNGDEIVDTVYGDKWSRANGDYNLIYSQLITYGYDEAKRLAEYCQWHIRQQLTKGNQRARW